MARLSALGRIQLRDHQGQDIEVLLRQPRRLVLLTYLAAADGGAPCRRDRLAGLFWPESSTEQAHHALRQAIHFLRKALGSDAIISRGKSELLLNEDAVACDLVDFARALAAGNAEEALSIYRGDFLDGLFVTGASEVEHWIDRKRDEFRRQAADAAWRLVDGHGAEEPRRDAIRWAERALDIAPYDERGIRRLMNFLAAGGNTAGAIGVFESFTVRMAAELEVAPSEETQALAQQLRARNHWSPEGRVTAASDSDILPPAKALAEPLAAAVRVSRAEQRRNLGRWGMVVAAATVAVLTVLMNAPSRSDTPSSTGVLHLAIDIPEHQTMVGGNGNLMALTSDGKRFAYKGWTPDYNVLYVRDLQETEASIVPGSRDAGYPFFSPDGRSLGFVREYGADGGRLYRAAVDGDSAMWLGVDALLQETDGNVGAWGPNDSILFVDAATRGLSIISVLGGASRSVTVPDASAGEVTHNSPQLLPDGRRAIFTIESTRERGPPAVAAVSLDDGSIDLLQHGAVWARYLSTGHLVFRRRGNNPALFSVALDLERFETTGPVRTVMAKTGAWAGYAMSSHSTFMHIPNLWARPKGRLAFLDSGGAVRFISDSVAVFRTPRLSPDGRYVAVEVYAEPADVAYAAGAQVAVFDVATGSLVSQTVAGSSNHPVWMPDGRLMFASNRAGTTDLYQRGPGGGPVEPYAAAEDHVFPTSAARDGSLSVLRWLQGVDSVEISVLAANGQWRSLPIGAESGMLVTPMLSPDGTYLAYVMDGVMVARTADPSFRIRLGNGKEPIWARDGHRLFFRSWDLDGAVASVEVRDDLPAADSPRIAPAWSDPFGRTYGEAWWVTDYDVLPDGETFLVIVQGKPPVWQPAVVLNWLEQVP